ncbi:hypothetical protein NQ315_006389 [Exocentrus adspersus]|uniref:Uncharacterized protein n=1 Tax=Exocentrus adspersus TaxID=1586481 RepID=A0AAV8W0H6_9CUCU|nr:hypothetical protein NQ315_006389 [Exocentrus adspersus]
MFRFRYILAVFLSFSEALSVPLAPSESTESTGLESDSNGTSQNLYVIKSVVYEIGILTDGDEDTEIGNETHEQVDVSFFDPGHNGSLIDLSNIPVPIQTNISGITVTGILPADLGSINLDENGTATINGSSFPVFPNKQFKITHNISTVDKDKSNAFLTSLPKILGLEDVFTSSNQSSKDEGNEGDSNVDSREGGDVKPQPVQVEDEFGVEALTSESD